MDIECTQRLECTQDLYNTQTEKTDPEQIGFLGICGTKHPVKRGPNKIGRDPQTCYINLNLNSISRQHAVINVLSMSEIMLMDLDSANKTKVQGKTLQPYIPHPLKDGDTVQFGAIFGIFRLLEDDNDLPMTQAIDLPCTPAPVTKHMSRLGAPSVLIPESPEVSDMDDSFVMPSQPKKSSEFKSPMNKFIKPSNKTVAIQPMGSKTIDNAYWTSSKKSDSFNFQLDDSGSTLNDSTVSNKSNKAVDESNDNIYEMETQQVPQKAIEENNDNIYQMETQQVPHKTVDESNDNIYEMETQQVPNKVVDESNDNIYQMETQQVLKSNENVDSIYTANTQLPPSPSIHNIATQQFVPNVRLPPSPSINNMETQQFESDIHAQDTQQVTDIHALDTQNVPDIHNCETQAPIVDKLPDVRKIHCREDLQYDLFSANKENDKSIHNAETQAFLGEKEAISVELKNPDHLNSSVHEKSKEKNDSDDEIVFDELNTQSFHEECESQPLIPAGNVSPLIERVEKTEVSSKRIRQDSGSSTDCEDFDILPTQKISTDIDMLPTQKIAANVDMLPTQKLINDGKIPLPTQKIVNDIEMLPTQKITNADDDDLTDCEDELVNSEVKESKRSPEIDFEDLATQIIGDDVIEAELNKNKDVTDGASKSTSFEELPTQVITDDKEDNFEDMATQIVIDEGQDKIPNEEVYSEEIVSPFKIPFPTPLKAKKTAKLAFSEASTSKVVIKSDDVDDPNYYSATQEILNDLCTQQDAPPEGDKRDTSSLKGKSNDEFVPCSVEDYEMGDRFRHIESGLSPVKRANSGGIKDNSEQHPNIASKLLTKGKSVSSDSNATVKTPKTLKIINIDLPDSQEIKTSVTLKHKSITESSSDSETDDVSDQDSGIIYGKKRKPKVNAKQDLSKKFEESLPSRIITRVRKPTLKLRESDESSKNQCKSILRSTIAVDSEDNIDAEIINENISRLKNKTDKKKEKEGDHSKRQLDETKKRPHSRNENYKIDKSIEKSANDKERSSRSKSKKTEKTKSNTEDQDDPKEKKGRSTRSTRNKKENDGKNEKSNKDKEKKESKGKDRSHSKSRSDSNSRSDSKSDRKTRSTSKDNKQKETKSKEKSKHDKTESSPEIETRRSSRQKGKDKQVTPKHENSTIYLSSESSTESPRNLKRPATNELEVPSPKRTRSLPNSKTSSASTSTSVNTSVCSTPVRAETQYVLFTAFSNDDVRSRLERLGAVLVSDVMTCTVLVTLQIKRTFKLLCAVGLGRPIVGPEWVQACADTNTIVDPWLYIIKDVPAEKRFRFSLDRTLRSKRNFLKGYNVSSTPSVLPNAQEMKWIVECSGGAWKAEGPNWICVSSSSDRALWGALRRRGATLVSTEFILGGVLRQHADVAGTVFGVPASKKKAASGGEFVCADCGRRCLSRIGLASHARSHTKS